MIERFSIGAACVRIPIAECTLITDKGHYALAFLAGGPRSGILNVRFRLNLRKSDTERSLMRARKVSFIQFRKVILSSDCVV
jgi:hypothetical protein